MRQQGFTLIELIVVMLVMAVLAAYVGTRWSFGDATVSTQAEQLARDLRHTQMLAMQQGRTLRLESIGGGYRVTDGASVILDPATHEDFIQALDNGVSLSGGPVEFDSLGRPVSGGSLTSAAVGFSLSGSSDTVAVSVAPVTGFVSGP
ncbi:hypothetical protein TspCOW1_25480 [Thiohalobacter sp. COW1]|uniref:GspH/FimT family pseudopilin n=1 Tax=Thiohalobacter sp. COW1 TaxID=2795687 RepID=UPI001916274E|nr:GspH/FimT family protein [Thiohalobacter sp. COW1]BCO32445.1 hypothetical protein TspCOW1_25480 [Thiohalobacter sp. COW1]